MMQRFTQAELQAATNEAIRLLQEAGDDGSVLAFNVDDEKITPYLTKGHGSSDLFLRPQKDGVDAAGWSIYQHLFSLYGGG